MPIIFHNSPGQTSTYNERLHSKPLKNFAEMLRLLVFITFKGFLFPVLVFADGHAENAQVLDPSQFFNLQFENDLFGSGEDSHFTHGTRISY